MNTQPAPNGFETTVGSHRLGEQGGGTTEKGDVPPATSSEASTGLALVMPSRPAKVSAGFSPLSPAAQETVAAAVDVLANLVVALADKLGFTLPNIQNPNERGERLAFLRLERSHVTLNVGNETISLGLDKGKFGVPMVVPVNELGRPRYFDTDKTPLRVPLWTLFEADVKVPMTELQETLRKGLRKLFGPDLVDLARAGYRFGTPFDMGSAIPMLPIHLQVLRSNWREVLVLLDHKGRPAYFKRYVDEGVGWIEVVGADAGNILFEVNCLGKRATLYACLDDKKIVTAAEHEAWVACGRPLKDAEEKPIERPMGQPSAREVVKYIRRYVGGIETVMTKETRASHIAWMEKHKFFPPKSS